MLFGIKFVLDLLFRVYFAFSAQQEESSGGGEALLLRREDRSGAGARGSRFDADLALTGFFFLQTSK